MDNADDSLDIEIHLPAHLQSLPDDGIPFIASYTIPNRETKWVILQNMDTDEFGKVMLVKFRKEDEEAYVLAEADADVLVLWNEGKGWSDDDGNLTTDVMAVGAIINALLNGFEDEEWIMDEEGSDPLAEFEGFYVITKEDNPEPVLYEVTIKGEMPEEGSEIGYYTVVYSDGSTKTIDWQPGEGFIERGKGRTAHSMSIGVLIDKHFGPKE